jgi:hypothetical protein
MSSAMTAAIATVRKPELRATAESDNGAAGFALPRSIGGTARGRRRLPGLGSPVAGQHEPPRRLGTSAPGASGVCNAPTGRSVTTNANTRVSREEIMAWMAACVGGSTVNITQK